MVLTLPGPPADGPETAWQEVVQGGLDRLGVLDSRDALQTMLAVTVIATHAVDACRLAFAPDASAVQALCQRASATALARVMAGAMRSLKQLRLQPAVPARDWGNAAAALAGVLREVPARPAEAARSGKAAAEEPAEIIRWIDEIDDAEMNEEIERLRREAAGEWDNMTKPEWREFFGYTYTGPVAPLEMLTPASRAAAAAGEA
jgi:hypothetical protein